MVDVINPNIVAGIGQQVNPLETLARFAYTQNALNQNLLFQQEYKARQAMGPLAQQSVDPQSGQIDWNKFATLVGTHPDTAWKAPEILNNIAQKKLIDAETTHAQLQNAQQRLGIFSQAAAAAVKDPTVNKGTDLTRLVGDMMAAGGFPEGDKSAIPWLTSMAPLQGAELKQRLGQLAMSTQQGADRLTALNGQYRPDAFHDANGNPVPGWISPTMQSAVPATAGPAAAMGAGPTTGAPAAAAAGVPGAMAQAAGVPQAAPQQPATPGGVPLTLGPVGPAQQARLGTIGDYQKGVNDEATFAYKSEQLVNELRNALKGVKTGAGTSAYVEAAQLAQTFGVSNKYVDEVARGDLGNLQEARKLMLRLATGDLRTALLPGAGRLTNTEFTAYQEANPNWDTDPRAIAKLLDFTHRMNFLAINKSHAYALASSAATRGEAIPGLPDITGFESYWLSKLQKSGFISPDTVGKLTGGGEGEQ